MTRPLKLGIYTGECRWLFHADRSKLAAAGIPIRFPLEDLDTVKAAVAARFPEEPVEVQSWEHESEKQPRNVAD